MIGVDEYGTVENNELGATLVASHLYHSIKPVVFAWSPDQATAHIFTIVRHFNKIGIMPFGGNPEGRAYIGIYGIGCNHISFGEVHPGYLEEKLRLDKTSAESFSAFWKIVSEKIETFKLDSVQGVQ
jgi:hypothetical protein